VFPRPNYTLRAPKNEITHLNWLHPHCAVVQSCDAEFIESLSKEGVATNGREKIKGFAECRIIQHLLESYQLMGVKGDFNG